MPFDLVFGVRGLLPLIVPSDLSWQKAQDRIAVVEDLIAWFEGTGGDPDLLRRIDDLD